MPARVTTKHRDTARRSGTRSPAAAWKLEDAKAKFSEVVRRARAEGPQRVTVRGNDAVVVIAAETFDRLMPAATPHQDLLSFLRGLAIGDLELTREHDVGRDIPL